MGEVGAREVGVGGEVNETKVNDELKDLENSDVLFPPNTNATGGLEVVPKMVNRFSEYPEHTWLTNT